MDAIQHQNQNEEANQTDSFNELIHQKKVRTTQFIQLKKLADSLINFSVKVEDDTEIINPKGNLFTERQFKSIIKIDTIKPNIVFAPL